MSSDYYRRQAQQHQQEIARLQRDKGSEVSRIAEYQCRINSASQSASRSSNLSSIQSYLRDAERNQNELARTQKKVADIEERIAREHAKLTDAQKHVAQEEEREFRERQRQAERQTREHEQIAACTWLTTASA